MVDSRDRTTVYIEVRASDRDSVVGIFGNPDDEEEQDTHNTLRLTFDEVNYGGPDLLSALARSRLAFRGSLLEGNEYCGASFAAVDGELEEVASPHGELMVRVDPRTLAIDTDDLAALRRWREVDNQVLAFFASADHPPDSAGE